MSPIHRHSFYRNSYTGAGTIITMQCPPESHCRSKFSSGKQNQPTTEHTTSPSLRKEHQLLTFPLSDPYLPLISWKHGVPKSQAVDHTARSSSPCLAVSSGHGYKNGIHLEVNHCHLARSRVCPARKNAGLGNIRP